MKNFMRIGVAVALLTASSISPTLAQDSGSGALPAGGAAGSEASGVNTSYITAGVLVIAAAGIAAAVASGHDGSAPAAAASTSTSTSTTGTP